MESAPILIKKVGYRTDIDGLRAVAVLLVLFDHLHIRCTGGYLGSMSSLSSRDQGFAPIKVIRRAMLGGWVTGAVEG
jgi:peptidoglycan/LPS O-acetylase OafA/YrhL